MIAGRRAQWALAIVACLIVVTSGAAGAADTAAPSPVPSLDDLEGLAVELSREGQHDQAVAVALQLAERADELPDAAFRERAVAYAVVARVLAAAGYVTVARKHSETALAIVERAVGPDHALVSPFLGNLASVDKAAGDAENAARLLERALAIEEKTAPDSLGVAETLRSLAIVYKTLGGADRLGAAAAALERALKIQMAALGARDPEVATTLRDLGEIFRFVAAYLAPGDHALRDRALASAQAMLQQALTIQEAALGPDDPRILHTLDGVAAAARDRRRFAEARALFIRSLDLRRKLGGPNVHDAATTLVNLALLEARDGKWSAAVSRCRETLRAEDERIRAFFFSSTEAEKLRFMASIDANYQACLTVVREHPRPGEPDRTALLDFVLRRKGLVMDAELRARVAAHAGPGDGPAWDVLDLAGVDGAAVARALPRDAALVEFVKPTHDFDIGRGVWKTTSRYLAAILTPDARVTVVDLGDAADADRLIGQALDAMRSLFEARSPGEFSRADAAGRRALTALHRRIWAPLAAATRDATTIVLSPDGPLSLVPFAALLDPQGRAVVERHRLMYVTSGRDLLPRAVSVPTGTGVLLVANPAFDAAPPAVPASGTVMRSSRLVRRFSPLPGTAREARDIPALLPDAPETVRVLTGADATRTAVKTARRPRLVHLATHGFFIPEEPRPLASPTIPAEPARRDTSTVVENALIRAGLVFAGANRATDPAASDDGILTALEIAGMDLHGTELVVLSACETAIGQVTTGEGVFGLRRAFTLAGARTLLMTLWPISDDVTARQMHAFYRALRTMPPAHALQHAQFETMRYLNTRYGTAPAALWAPFIVQGGQAVRP